MPVDTRAQALYSFHVSSLGFRLPGGSHQSRTFQKHGFAGFFEF